MCYCYTFENIAHSMNAKNKEWKKVRTNLLTKKQAKNKTDNLQTKKQLLAIISNNIFRVPLLGR